MPGELLLLVEDDDGIATNLVRALTASGYVVQHSRSARETFQAFASTTSTLPSLVILDLGLPDVDGLDVCRSLSSKHPDVPIVILTARREEIDLVIGLDAGAVDYLTKPFHLTELLARVRTHLRRTSQLVSSSEDSAVVNVGDLRIDRDGRRAWVGDRELELRNKEFDLLTLLARCSGRVVTRQRIMAEVWDEHWFGSTKTLDVHIATLRRQLENAGIDDCITTLRGVGYRLESV